jgi:hypothetical protein
MKKKYVLHVEEKNNKGPRYHYYVTEEGSSDIISERKSNREYAACTINGQYYFGRLDLIGKGDHGRTTQLNNKNNRDQLPIAYLSEADTELLFPKKG